MLVPSVSMANNEVPWNDASLWYETIAELAEAHPEEAGIVFQYNEGAYDPFDYLNGLYKFSESIHPNDAKHSNSSLHCFIGDVSEIIFVESNGSNTITKPPQFYKTEIINIKRDSEAQLLRYEKQTKFHKYKRNGDIKKKAHRVQYSGYEIVTQCDYRKFL